jgi:hypothetical protein
MCKIGVPMESDQLSAQRQASIIAYSPKSIRRCNRWPAPGQ